MALKIYQQKASVEFWEKHWQAQKIKNFFADVKYSPLLPIFLKYLSKKDKILEAGCGLGQWVFYLSKKGFDIIGIDNAEKAIKKTRKIYPALKIKNADLLKLPFKKDCFDAILCLGLLEHFEADKTFFQALKEIKQVMKNKGLFFCSVPYFNPLRIIKNTLGFYPKKGSFYQYAFKKKEFCKKLEKMNFKILKVIPFDSYNGIKKEIFPKLGGKLYRSLKPAREGKSSQANSAQGITIKKYLKKIIFICLKKILESRPFRFIFSHMLLFIAEKQK